jgi:hypothetical protein
LNIVLRGKGLEEKEVLTCEDEVLEFISCCSATVVGESISPFNGIIMKPANTMVVANVNRFLIGDETPSLEDMMNSAAIL